MIKEPDLLNLPALFAAMEHRAMGKTTPAWTKLRWLNLEEEDIWAEVASSLWRASLSPKSRWDPKRSSRGTYLYMVTNQSLCKIIRRTLKVTSQPQNGRNDFSVDKLESRDREDPIVDAQGRLVESIRDELAAPGGDLTEEVKGAILLLLTEGAKPFSKGETDRIASEWLKDRLSM